MVAALVRLRPPSPAAEMVAVLRRLLSHSRSPILRLLPLLVEMRLGGLEAQLAWMAARLSPVVGRAKVMVEMPNLNRNTSYHVLPQVSTGK